MIEVTQLRAGTVFDDPSTHSAGSGQAGSGQATGPWVVVKYEHVKMGRGTANIKLKVKSLKSKVTKEITFINGARVQEVNLEKKKAQYLYKNGDSLMFMDPVTYEQFEVSPDLVGGQAKFLKEGMEVDLQFYGDEPLAVALPLKMKFEVTDTEPGFRGNSVTNLYKEATIDTGARIKVPLFVNIGEGIVVNTETGEYVERAK